MKRQRGNIYNIKDSKYNVALGFVNIWSILGGKCTHIKAVVGNETLQWSKPTGAEISES